MDYLLGGILPYVSLTLLLGGLAARLTGWLRRPVPLQVTLFPVPEHRLKAWVAELLAMRTLCLRSRSLWLLVWPMHLALASVVAGHFLGISFLRGQFTLLGLTREGSVRLSGCLGFAAGVTLSGTLVALLIRRVRDPDVRRLTEPLMWFDLLLLLAIALSGMALYLPACAADLPAVRAYLASLLLLHPAPPPHNPVLLLHLSLVCLLAAYFPFSGLMHAAGFFINRAILMEEPPIFPTPGHRPLRSPFAGPGMNSGLFTATIETGRKPGPPL